jgi:site-specific DNA-methyltransferase (adenine-specific)
MAADSDDTGVRGDDTGARGDDTDARGDAPARDLSLLPSAEHPHRLFDGDNLPILRALPDASVNLAYLDPPFNTGRSQLRRVTRHERDPAGARTGYAGTSYTMHVDREAHYADRFDDYAAFLAPRLAEVHRLLAPTGTLYLHLDYREAHYAKVALDQLFGRECFLNEIIWAYDYGAKSRKRWPTKHDTILVYVKDPKRYHFDSDAVDREPYMAPGLVTPEKAARGKLPTDVWWHTIVTTSGREKTGYPTQKPEGILRRIVTASSRDGDVVLDPFAGSGTTAAVARTLGRRSISIDESPDALTTIEKRLGIERQRFAD